jgi:RNA polymerase sigma factor (sigma-70 family)
MTMRKSGPWLHPERQWEGASDEYKEPAADGEAVAPADPENTEENESGAAEQTETEDAGAILREMETIDDDRDAQNIYQNFCADIRKFPLLTAEEERILARRIREEKDEAAFQRFVLSNLRLVIACAKRIQRKFGNNSILSFMDLVQEGIMGLLTAVERFDYRRETRFSTYGIYWITQKIRRAMAAHRPGVTVPCYTGDCLRSMSEYLKAYQEGQVEKIPPKLLQRVRMLHPIAGPFISLDVDDEDPRGGGGTIGPLSERLDASRVLESGTGQAGDHFALEESVARDMFRVDLMRRLRESLDNPMKFDILCRRFGLPPYQVPQSLKEISTTYNKSPECIRTILLQVTKRLRLDENMKEFHRSWEVPEE